jgi:hypothetical protein
MELARQRQASMATSDGLGAMVESPDPLALWRTSEKKTRNQWMQQRFASEKSTVRKYVAAQVYDGPGVRGQGQRDDARGRSQSRP